MFVGRYRVIRTSKEAKEHRKQVIQIVKDFGEKNNIPVKCQSDQVLLYIKYIIDTIEKFRNEEIDKEFKELVYSIHKETRGNIMEIGIMVPSSLAVAILSMAVRLYKGKKRRIMMTQKEMGDCIDMGMQQQRITYSFRKLDEFFQRKNIPYPIDDGI